MAYFPPAVGEKLRDPLIVQLFLRGLARPDPLFLGFDVNDQGQLLDAAGHAVPNLHTLGSPQKGRLFETTAVPERRQQAFELAMLIAEDLQKIPDWRSKDCRQATLSTFE